MSDRPPEPTAGDFQRLAELAERLRAGALADAEVAELETLLAETPGARETFAALAMLDVELRQAHGRFTPVVPKASRPASRFWPRRTLWLPLAAGLVLAAVLAGQRWPWLEPAAGAVTATVSNGSGAVLLRNHRVVPVAIGAPVSRGELELRSGLLELTYPSGVVIVIEAPARFDLRDANTLWLAQGNLSARAPGQASGFTVETPSARIVDLGTEFGVSAAAASSEVHVFKGMVLVTNRDVPDPLRLTENCASRIDTQTHTPVGIAYEPGRFVRTFEERASEFARQLRALDPVAYYRMRITPEATLLRDVSAHHLDGVIVPGSSQSTTVTGRIGAGLRLGGPATQSYAVVRDFPKAPTPALTVCAWVRADSRPRWASIAKHWAKDGGRNGGGQFHFGLWHDDGSLEVHVHDAARREVGVRETEPLPIGEWQFVAFTLDGATLRLYRNGREVAAAPCRGLSSSAPNGLGIGVKLDRGLAPERNTPGFWDGVLDELAIFHRALSAEQILALYQLAP